jgi:hypothetical protein
MVVYATLPIDLVYLFYVILSTSIIVYYLFKLNRLD